MSPLLLIAVAYTILRILLSVSQAPITEGGDPSRLMIAGMTRDMLSFRALSALLLGFAFFRLPERWVMDIGVGAWCATLVLTAAFVILGSPPEVARYASSWWPGAIYNPAMNAALLMVLTPFAGRNPVESALSFVIAAALAFYCSSSSAALVFVGFVLASLAHSKPKALAPAALILATALFFVDFPFEDRGEMYRLFMGDWWKNHSVLFGAGVNQFALLSPPVQAAYGRESAYWIMLHSDILQLLFEQGLVGLLLWGACYVQMLVVSYRHYPRLFEVGVGFIPFLAFYFPLHTSFGAVVLMLLFWTLSEAPTAPKN